MTTKPTGQLANPLGDPLSEASLSRVYQHWMGAGFAALTSWRQRDPRTGKPVSHSTNASRLRQLQQDIRAAGYGYVPLTAVWREEGEKEPHREPSLLVPATKRDGSDGSDELRALAQRWGKKYLQDSILFVEPGGRGQIIATTPDAFGRVEHTFSRFRPGDANWIWSQLRRGDRRAFFLESTTIDPPPHSWSSAMLRLYRGEIPRGSRPDDLAS